MSSTLRRSHRINNLSTTISTINNNNVLNKISAKRRASISTKNKNKILNVTTNKKLKTHNHNSTHNNINDVDMNNDDSNDVIAPSKKSRKTRLTTKSIVSSQKTKIKSSTKKTPLTITKTTKIVKITKIKSNKSKKVTKVEAIVSEEKSTVIDSMDPSSYKKGTLSRDFENKLISKHGYKIIVGVDEAGRGPLAGPVVSAACYIPSNVHIIGINDSKQLTEAQREHLFNLLTTHPDIKYSVSILDHKIIDEINILQATMRAMQETIDNIPLDNIDYVLIDGNKKPDTLTIPGEAVIKGDGKVYCIAAASIIAKVTRDRIMLEFHKKYPLYGFAIHKGYGVKSHMQAIYQHGPCEIHRKTYAPMKNMINN